MAYRKKTARSKSRAPARSMRRKGYGGKARSGSNRRKSGGRYAGQTVKIVVETVAARDQSPLTPDMALAKPAPAPRARQF